MSKFDIINILSSLGVGSNLGRIIFASDGKIWYAIYFVLFLGIWIINFRRD